MTDCGAGGLSSAVGEMGDKVGALVELDKVPLKYAGLRYDEIWISEAQERMVLSVPPAKLDELLTLSRGEDVEATVIGTFGTRSQELILTYRGREVGRMAMDFIHHGIPMPRRTAVVIEHPRPAAPHSAFSIQHSAFAPTLLSLLAHPNIASKHWVIRQYDHEVQGGSVIKPLTGPLQVGPSDAAVLRPKLTSHRGVAVGCGMSPHITDPYAMSIAAIDEAIRNVVAVGASPDRIAILDNFCWPSVEDDVTMGDLVRTCEACRDAALAYRIPFISGKDSLHNQFTDSETGKVLRIPNTLLISAIAVIEDVRRCVTMDLKRSGNRLSMVTPAGADLATLAATHRALSEAIGRGLIHSCHDVSDGGAAVAAAEMSIASGLGLDVRFESTDAAFGERLASYLVEIDPATEAQLQALFAGRAMLTTIGVVTDRPELKAAVGGDSASLSIEKLTTTWRGTLDW